MGILDQVYLNFNIKLKFAFENSIFQQAKKLKYQPIV
jgi:hypothetical protein